MDRYKVGYDDESLPITEIKYSKGKWVKYDDIEDYKWDKSGELHSLKLDNIDLKIENKRLWEYATHNNMCWKNFEHDNCDCGFDDLLKDKK